MERVQLFFVLTFETTECLNMQNFIKQTFETIEEIFATETMLINSGIFSYNKENHLLVQILGTQPYFDNAITKYCKKFTSFIMYKITQILKHEPTFNYFLTSLCVVCAILFTSPYSYNFVLQFYFGENFTHQIETEFL